MSITAWKYNTDADLTPIVDKIQADPGRIIEFGGASTKFYRKLPISRCVDREKPWADDTAESWETTDLNRGYCREYQDRVKLYKWAICTHTIEDLHWPIPLLEAMPQVAERGYISVPSAYIEMTAWGGSIGFIHHRWLFTVEGKGDNAVLVCWPKIPLLRSDVFDAARTRTAAKGTIKNKLELELWWEGDLPFRVVEISDDRDKVIAAYRSLVEGRCDGMQGDDDNETLSDKRRLRMQRLR
jgi:hypothetical protein